MDPQALKQLVRHAKEDPQFFHDLVFDPEKVLASLDYIDRQSKAALLSLNPEHVIEEMIAPRRIRICDPTCGLGSCAGTCGAPSCDTTCLSSCVRTCAGSCGCTTAFVTGA